MNFFSISLLCVALVGPTTAFQVGPIVTTTTRQQSRLFSTLDGTNAPSLDKSSITAGPKERLLDVAYDLKHKYGVFVIDKNGQEVLRRAVADLESVSERPAFDIDTKQTMLGDWTLVCTTSSSSSMPSPIASGIDTSKLPFFNHGPLKEIRDSVNKCLVVQQSIKMGKDSEEIERVDHTLEYRPPKTLQDLLDKLPSLNINPLDITKGRLVLVHEAGVSNKGPGFSIELKLASVVVNIAGTSQYLDPSGQDVFGVNSPMKEFQAGTFETTFLDDNFRISRTTMGSTSQLRIYVKSEEQETPADSLDEEYFDEFDKFGTEEEMESEIVDVSVADDITVKIDPQEEDIEIITDSDTEATDDDNADKQDDAETTDDSNDGKNDDTESTNDSDDDKQDDAKTTDESNDDKEDDAETTKEDITADKEDEAETTGDKAEDTEATNDTADDKMK